MSRAIWTKPAQDDLAGIDDRYADINAAFADRAGRSALAAGRFLAEHPAAGAEATANFRRWRVKRTPYLLLYRIVLDGVEILRVVHNRQDWSAF